MQIISSYKALFVSVLVFACGCGKKKTAEMILYSDYMEEAENFVGDYKSGDVERAKKACLRDWAIGMLKCDIPNYERAYAVSMVFSAERLAVICRMQNDKIGADFWSRWRDDNVWRIGMTVEEVTNGVFQLDREMGVSYGTKQ
jgi:hypothetical protein